MDYETVIPQKLLDAYVEAIDRAKKSDRAKEQLKEQIKDLLREGARTEGGPLVAYIKPTTQLALSRQKVGAVIGSAALARRLEDIEPTVVERLVVKKAPVCCPFDEKPPPHGVRFRPGKP